MHYQEVRHGAELRSAAIVDRLADPELAQPSTSAMAPMGSCALYGSSKQKGQPMVGLAD
jgi:hypothetical protein